MKQKKGNGNSYKSPDSVNQIDWNRKEKYHDVFEYYQKLIQLRKNHPAFRMTDAEQIRTNLNFCTQYEMGVVSYCIDGKSAGDSWKNIIIIFNAKTDEVSIPLPEGNYQIVARGDKINETGLGEFVTNKVVVEEISMLILIHA